MEYQKSELISDLVVWHLGDVLVKYLDLYWESDVDLYLDIMLGYLFGVKMDFQKYLLMVKN